MLTGMGAELGRKKEPTLLGNSFERPTRVPAFESVPGESQALRNLGCWCCPDVPLPKSAQCLLTSPAPAGDCKLL